MSGISYQRPWRRLHSLECSRDCFVGQSAEGERHRRVGRVMFSYDIGVMHLDV